MRYSLLLCRLVIYGENSFPYILKRNGIVEVVINHYDDGGHPIHMHGHNFQMVVFPPRTLSLPQYNGESTCDIGAPPELQAQSMPAD